MRSAETMVAVYLSTVSSRMPRDVCKTCRQVAPCGRPVGPLPEIGSGSPQLNTMPASSRLRRFGPAGPAHPVRARSRRISILCASKIYGKHGETARHGLHHCLGELDKGLLAIELHVNESRKSLSTHLWHQVTMMILPPGAVTRASSRTNRACVRMPCVCHAVNGKVCANLHIPLYID
jgi:hypothetical protein